MNQIIGRIEIYRFNNEINKQIQLPALSGELYFIDSVFEASCFYKSKVIAQILDKIKLLSDTKYRVLIPKSIKPNLEKFAFTEYLDSFLETSGENYIANSYDFMYDLAMQYGEVNLLMAIVQPKRSYNCDEDRDFWFDDIAIRITNGNLNKSLIICKNKAYYIDGGDKQVKLNKVDFSKLVSFFEDWYNFLLAYESCQIPGILPESKLKTWSHVPNEYIKPEWWELQQKREEEKEA